MGGGNRAIYSLLRIPLKSGPKFGNRLYLRSIVALKATRERLAESCGFNEVLKN